MEEKKKSRLPVVLAIIFVLILAVLYAYIYIFPQLDGSRRENTLVSYASIRASATLKCIVARDETVYTSGGPGTVSYYVEEGVKTRRGIRVADVYSGNRQSLYTLATGFVTYYLDGAEDRFRPDAFSELDPDEVAAMDDIVPSVSKPGQVEEDTPLFKVINSNTWYMLILVPENMRGQYTIGQNVKVSFGEDAVLPARISSVRDGEHYQIAVAEISRWYDKFLQLRTVEAEIISSDTEGLLIPTSSIATNGENFGVYVQGLDGDYTFKTIEVLIDGPENTLISSDGSVRLYDEVLKDASKYSK